MLCATGNSQHPVLEIFCSACSNTKTGLVLCNRPKRLTYLCCNWLSWLSVVKVSGDMELQQLAELPDDMLWGAVLILPLKLAV